MAVSLSSTLSSLLLNPYAQQNALQAAQPRGAVDPIRPGATITARYTVEQDGALALRDVSVVDEAADSTSEQQSQKKQQAQEQARPNYSFADISKPKTDLNPVDDLALFAQFAGASATDPLRLNGPAVRKEPANEPGITMLDANGNEAPDANALTLASQKQQKVAFLYARNADITYNVNPIFSQAA